MRKGRSSIGSVLGVLAPTCVRLLSDLLIIPFCVHYAFLPNIL